jgi:hypothetical protein
LVAVDSDKFYFPDIVFVNVGTSDFAITVSSGRDKLLYKRVQLILFHITSCWGQESPYYNESKKKRKNAVTEVGVEFDYFHYPDIPLSLFSLDFHYLQRQPP